MTLSTIASRYAPALSTRKVGTVRHYLEAYRAVKHRPELSTIAAALAGQLSAMTGVGTELGWSAAVDASR